VPLARLCEPLSVENVTEVAVARGAHNFHSLTEETVVDFGFDGTRVAFVKSGPAAPGDEFDR